jgi:hypothetical protein
VATRKTSVNIRFGRPGGAGLQHEEILFAGNEAPFTWNITTDPLSGTTGGILENCAKQGFLPKIMHTLSSTEYWQMRMSLRTTDVYGKTDLEIPKNVRIYHFASTQHTLPLTKTSIRSQGSLTILTLSMIHGEHCMWHSNNG